jgi:thioredoxin reductase
MNLDIHSLNAMAPQPTESIELLVIGGGDAGATAAVAAAKAGIKVVLVDENPLDPGLIGLDVPLAFGQRATPAVQNRQRLIEQIAQNSPRLMEAFEEDVEVRLSTTAWGIFTPSPATGAIKSVLVGLEDGERSWVAECAHVIVATGCRDVMLGFEGCDQPGVMGAQALESLLHKYDAAASRKMVVLGSGELAWSTAVAAESKGIEVVGLVEPAAKSAFAPASADGIKVHTRTIIKSAAQGADGVESVVLVSLDTNGHPVPGTEQTIVCDTVCVAIGLTPSIELLAAAGAKTRFDEGFGIWLPNLSGTVTSIPHVQAVGGCAGSDEFAESASSAARLAASGQDIAGDGDIPAAQLARAPKAELEKWMDALIDTGGLDVVVCRCESVTRADILDVSPPTYLGARTGPTCSRSLATLLADGPPNPDQVKRLTRSGMGECQGRRCREQTACLLARSAGLPLSAVPMATYRAPVRPLPLSVISATTETPEMRGGWDSWFGIPTQFLPYWEDEQTEGQTRSGTGWHL